MTQLEFKNEMSRLKIAFGERYYSEEHLKILWSDVKDLSRFAFEKIVTKSIAESKTAPTIKAVRMILAQAREDARTLQRERESNEAKKFWNGVGFPKEEIKNIVFTIRKRMSGQCSDGDWVQFMEVLDYSAKDEDRKIKQRRTR